MSDQDLADILRRLQALEQWRDRNKVEVPIYATGTWTPTMTGGTTAGMTTYPVNGQIGNYTQMGRQATASAVVEWTGATGTGNMRLSLPFASAAGTRRYYAVSVYTDGITIGANYTPYGVLFAGVDYIELYTPANNAASTAIAVEAAGTVIYTVTYFLS